MVFCNLIEQSFLKILLFYLFICIVMHYILISICQKVWFTDLCTSQNCWLMPSCMYLVVVWPDHWTKMCTNLTQMCTPSMGTSKFCIFITKFCSQTGTKQNTHCVTHLVTLIVVWWLVELWCWHIHNQLFYIVNRGG